MEVDDYESNKLYDQMNNDIDYSFSIEVRGKVFKNLTLGELDLFALEASNGISLFKQTFSNVKLVSQNYNSSADDVLSVNLSYKGYLNS
jgi:hypothetical protein